MMERTIVQGKQRFRRRRRRRPGGPTDREFRRSFASAREFRIYSRPPARPPAAYASYLHAWLSSYLYMHLMTTPPKKKFQIFFLIFTGCQRVVQLLLATENACRMVLPKKGYQQLYTGTGREGATSKQSIL